MSTTTLRITQYALAGLALATLVASHVLGWGLPNSLHALLGGVAGWLAVMRPVDAKALRGK